jgi:hypothetical protein
VPEILTSGNHGAIARWRRDQAFARTAVHRPELLARLDPAALDKKDRIALAALGWHVDGDRLVPDVGAQEKAPDEPTPNAPVPNEPVLGEALPDDFADQPPA